MVYNMARMVMAEAALRQEFEGGRRVGPTESEP